MYNTGRQHYIMVTSSSSIESAKMTRLIASIRLESLKSDIFKQSKPLLSPRKKIGYAIKLKSKEVFVI